MTVDLTLWATLEVLQISHYCRQPPQASASCCDLVLDQEFGLVVASTHYLPWDAEDIVDTGFETILLSSYHVVEI